MASEFSLNSDIEANDKIMGRVELVAGNSAMTNSDHDYTSGVWLTWKDVWVTVPNRRGGSKILVQGLTGSAQPGQMVAIMGPFGSGKSTLLDALAGREGATRQVGDILVNGRRQTLSYGTSAYVSQDDILMAALTVGEAVFYSAQLELPHSMSTTKKRERAEITIKQMGLHDSINTRIGGLRMKGLSGGQKRRVSIAMEILTQPKLLFLDEPTSGLDNVAAYHVMKRIATLVREDARTIVASIHQPSSEVFELFRNLYLLTGGRTVYFGEASQTSQDIEGGDSQGCITTSQAIDKLVTSYHSSSIAKAIVRKVNEMSKMARGGMLMFVASFLTFMTIGGFSSFAEDMRVFGRERLNGHYGVMAYVIANTVSSIPYLMLISAIPGAIAYFLVNLHGGFDHFIFFVLVLFACMALVESLMMIAASIIPDFLLGIITGAGIQGVMILNGGFFRLPNDTPKPFWKYTIFYISFHTYAKQAFYKNDFTGLNFTNKQAGVSPIRGEDILRDTWQVEMGYSKWVDLLILGGMVIVYRLLFFTIIKLKEKLRPLVRAKLSSFHLNIPIRTSPPAPEPNAWGEPPS
ncbi:hypothetical protein KI387_000291 [Taxus chinensis]|uniref:ABC transporter domain-containing protein n=1 Tax=Taxus chinensis TaxID=29808 RepID=A0AA38GTV3_TAXCH|nr:hypothetical protein KI387_000291 [Taxus chinensis]